MLLKKNQWVNEEIKEKIRKYLETNKNGNTALPKLWFPAMVLERVSYIVRINT